MHNLEVLLGASFEAEPLEDGIIHPAEEIIAEALRSREKGAVLDLLRRLSLDASQPDFAADVFGCVGRQERPGSVDWRIWLVRDGLACENFLIRDAAAQAADAWDEQPVTEVLKGHKEPIGWLDRYIKDIISN